VAKTVGQKRADEQKRLRKLARGIGAKPEQKKPRKDEIIVNGKAVRKLAFVLFVFDDRLICWQRRAVA
jgi:hypothetical protein